MNFQELMKRMAELDQPVQEEQQVDEKKVEEDDMEEGNEFSGALAKAKAAGAKEFEVDGKTYQVKEDTVEECGMMGDMGAMSAPKQQDSVTMNVSMNGNGAGGIRDLLNVLKDIQDGPSDDMPGDDMDMGPEEPGDDVLLKKSIDSMAKAIDDDFANSMPGDDGPEMIPPHNAGNDLHKEKEAFPKANGGDNAMRLKDGATYKLPKGDIQIKLESLYQEIKKR